MKKISRKFILIIGLLTLLTVSWLIYFKNSILRDVIVVKRLESRILPYLQNNDITFYFDVEWCNAMKYRSLSISEASDRNIRCVAKAGPFTQADRIVFNEVKNRLQSIHVEKFKQIDTEYLVKFVPEQKKVVREPIGVSFYVDCLDCSTRYIFWPDYNQIPSDVQGRIKYVPINKNWYKVEQDW